MIESITVRGLLSYGWEGVTLPLGPLNLLIGPNGSGKSNLLDLLDLLRGAVSDVQRPFRERGGAEQWLHRGGTEGGRAMVEVVLGATPAPLRYRLGCTFAEGGAVSLDEQVETRDPHPEESPAQLLVSGGGRATFKVFHSSFAIADPLFGPYRWDQLDLPVDATALALLRGNPNCPAVTEIAGSLAGIHLFQGWTFGPGSPARDPGQDSGLPGSRPVAGGSNLAVVLHRLRQDGAAWGRIRDSLRDLYAQIDDVETAAEAGTVKFWLRERGRRGLVPPSRISDGTLRWLALLCLLLDPAPPPLLAIEEPELGLHPDLIYSLGNLLREAAERTQLIVTTHSDLLVSAFSDRPADVVVCERELGATTLRRLEPDLLVDWLERYKLGEVWRRGALGGTRW